MTCLTKIDILNKFKEEKIENRLIINPSLNPNQIGSHGIDLRLSCDLIIPQKIQINAIDVLMEEKILRKNLKTFTNRIKLNYGDSITLHPGDFVIGNTFEYIYLPRNIVAFLHGRSTWGRLGLIVHATAGVVHPNYQGVLTFELTNLGSLPILLYPLERIAQLIFFETKSKLQEKIKGSQFSKDIVSKMPELIEDYDREYLLDIKKKRQEEEEEELIFNKKNK